ncbi:MAG: HAMP domain-containing protein [Planctomycetes bacterium]|nr:HAMP domain-containing protein [Planctomycetota bacterium]
MSLQVKILIIVLAVVSLYAALDYTCQRFLVLPSFVAMEHNEAQNKMRRCIGMIRREISDLNKLTKNWAASDQTYQSVEDRNSRDSSTNLGVESLTKNNLNLIYICDIRGNVVWGEIRDIETNEAIQLKELPGGRWSQTHPLLGHKTVQSYTTGIFLTERGPMLIASRPIITSRNEGPIRGTFITGRFLDDSVLEEVTAHVPVDLKLWTIADDFVPAEDREALNHLKAESQFHIRQARDNLLHVYTLFSDIQEVPALLMRADIPQDIRTKGVARLIRSSFLSNLTAGLSVMLVLLLLLRQTVVTPVRKLTSHVVAIGKARDMSARVSMQRSDEIGVLAQEFNCMVEQLSQAREKLLEQSFSLGKAEMASKVLDETRKRAAELEEAYKKLENANQELKDFAHIVSHDLKAPLRGIKIISDWILTDYADKFDEDGREQMNSLSSRVEWMYKLIEGVLEYSRVGRVKEERVEVDLNKVVPEIIDVVAAPENIVITLESELPVIECEKTRITQVFENLLSNAIKYMDKPQGQIKIGCVEEDGFWKFSVADNGHGIEERHFERIFQIFQTVEQHDKFESTGVGLTVIKKIVELYDGKIWVESKVGEGSTFFFTLPKQEMRAKNVQLEASITC